MISPLGRTSVVALDLVYHRRRDPVHHGQLAHQRPGVDLEGLGHAVALGIDELVRHDLGLARDVGELQQIQDKGKAVSAATTGMQIAVSMDKPIVGRQIFEKDTLFVKVPEPDVRAFQGAFADKLNEEEKQALKDFVIAMRKKSPFFAF